MTSQALNRPVDVIGVLDAAGANPYAEEGSPACELARLGQVVAKLIEADRLMDQCDVALESHRGADVYGEAWAATQLELHRTRDLAAKRRAAALTCISGDV